jgi:glycosyltransferase involved in cell wall biosynthesis
MDGGSVDSSLDIIRSHERDIAFWKSEPDAGQTEAINKGLAMADGEIVAWLNSDDLLEPHAVSRAVQVFQADSSIDIVFGDCVFIDENGIEIGRSKERAEFDYEHFILECENPIPQPSAFIRRRVFTQAGLLDTSLHYKMDWEFWTRAGLRHRIVHVPEVWSSYRLHEYSKTMAHSHRGRMPAELERLYRALFERADLPVNVRRNRKVAFANMYFTAAGYAISGGDAKAGAALGWRALRSYPQMLCSPRMLHKLLYCTIGLLHHRPYRRLPAAQKDLPCQAIVRPD